ncbi:MAG: alkaline phosphatase family protein [Candidatus Nanohaloarchaea archaeon]
MMIIGVDAATWDMIEPHREELPSFDRLMNECDRKTITVEEEVKSAPIWTSIFTGLRQSEHGHKDFVVNDELQRKEDIDATFVWEKLPEDIDARVLQVPAVIPPINYNSEYEPLGFGVSSNLEELGEDMDRLGEKAVEVLKDQPDFFAIVFIHLDRVSHFYWNQKDTVLEYYRKVDERIGDLLEYYDFGSDEPLIVLSDHGFAGFGEAEVQTLPEETPHGSLEGDHHEDAVLMTKNVSYDIEDPEDVGRYILDYYGVE